MCTYVLIHTWVHEHTTVFIHVHLNMHTHVETHMHIHMDAHTQTYSEWGLIVAQRVTQSWHYCLVRETQAQSMNPHSNTKEIGDPMV